MYWSIRHKISLSLFINIFLLTLLILCSQQYLTYQQFKDHLRKDAEITVDLAVDQANQWFSRQKVEANMLKLETERLFFLSQNFEQEFPNTVHSLGLENAYYASEDGNFFGVGAVPQKRKDNFKDSDWYKKAKDTNQSVFLGPYPGGNNDEYVLTFSAPVQDNLQWNVRGIVGFDVPIESLRKAIGSIFISEIEELQVYPLSSGRIGVLVKEKNITPETLATVKEIYEKAQRPSGKAFLVDGNIILLMYSDMPGTEMTLIYPISMSHLILPIVYQTIGLIAASLVGLLILFWVSLSVIGRYVKRIEVLNERTKRIAAGNFETEVPQESKDEIGDLAASFSKMTTALVAHMDALKESVRYKERINRELELAAEMQQKALPEKLPKLNELELAAKSLPAYEVGGDYYDFVFPDPNKIGLVIADATGKGFSGTLFMTNSRSIFRVISTDEKEPGALLRKMNDFMSENSPGSGMFITLLYGIFEKDTRRFTYSNAGHLAPLLYNTKLKRFIELGVSEMPLGIIAGRDYKTETIQLNEDDILVFYTDGVVEAMNSSREMFGIERVMKITRENAHKEASYIFQTIEKEVHAFAGAEPQSDDITLMVMKIH